MLFWLNKIEIRAYVVFRALESRAWPFDPELGLRGKAYAVCIINPKVHCLGPAQGHHSLKNPKP